MSATSSNRIALRYEIASTRDDWVLPEDPVPESQPHDHTVEFLRAQLAHRISTRGFDMQVARNLALRWVRARPQIGIDPDVCVISPATPEGEELESLCTWKPGHTPPIFAVEVVSRNHPWKDYAEVPERYAASGTSELVVFDGRLIGPKKLGGPYRIQLWRRLEDDTFERTYAGEGPVFSQALGAFLFAVDEGRRLRLADDREGTSWWPTAEEANRAESEALRMERDAALSRIAALEAELRRRGGG